MNPFVGLSKVTKKRLDALENITTEVDSMKTKLKDIETVFEKSGHILPITPQINQKQEPKKEPQTTTPADPKATPQTPPAAPQPTTTPSIPLPTETAPPSPTMTTSTVMTPLPPTIQPMTTILSDQDVDILLTKALESLIIEQSIDSVMNDFFTTLR